MARRYFDLHDDVYIPGCWALGDPTDPQGREIDDPWQFADGCPVRVEQRLKVPITRPGKPLDFSLAGIGVAPIVHARVASLLAEMAPGDVQIIPVEVDSQPDPYCILVATRLIRCIDDAASEEVEYWMPEDGQPEKVGEYRNVAGMRINPAKVGDAKVFRTWGWPIALIVSEDIKDAMERAGITGARFEEVTGPSTTNPEERERWKMFRERWQQADTAREATWRILGRLEKEAIIPIVVGGSWPSRRQAWRTIYRPGGHLLLVTDGLSDPFYGQTEPSTGFGLELALETDEPIEDVERSWPLLLLERVANEVADHEHVRERAKAGLMSMEVSGKGVPKALVTEEGRVGVLLGMDSSTLPQHFTMPAGEVRLVTVKVLLPAELSYLLKHGRNGREELLRRFSQSGQKHLSRVQRQPVVTLS